MQFKTYVQLLMGITGFGAWSLMVFYDPSLQADYLKFIQATVIGLAALALRDMPSRDYVEPTNKESLSVQPEVQKFTVGGGS